MAQIHSLSAGRVVGRDFRIVRALASGAMGAVYIVDQLSTSKQRAMKVMAPSLATSTKARKRFVLEAQVGGKIESDHVVEVVAAGIDDDGGLPYLVMELLKGDDLAQRLRKEKRIKPQQTMEIMAQVAHALEAAHAQQIVHRDIKPQNFFIAKSRRQGIASVAVDGSSTGVFATGNDESADLACAAHALSRTLAGTLLRPAHRGAFWTGPVANQEVASACNTFSKDRVHRARRNDAVTDIIDVACACTWTANGAGRSWAASWRVGVAVATTRTARRRISQALAVGILPFANRATNAVDLPTLGGNTSLTLSGTSRVATNAIRAMPADAFGSRLALAIRPARRTVVFLRNTSAGLAVAVHTTAGIVAASGRPPTATGGRAPTHATDRGHSSDGAGAGVAARTPNCLRWNHWTMRQLAPSEARPRPR